ncbi:MAG TPA: hypothetical protein VGD43_09790 [Micromonospora sp.]
MIVIILGSAGVGETPLTGTELDGIARATIDAHNDSSPGCCRPGGCPHLAWARDRLGLDQAP